MIQQFDHFQKFGQDNLDTMMKTFGSVTKGAQAIAMETADYAKKSVEHSAAAFEKLAGAKSLDKAMQIHGDYLKTSYEGFVAQSTKLGELYQAVAKEDFKPFEGFVTKAAGK